MTRENFKKFAEKLRGFGFRVYLSKPETPYNYAIFTDGVNIGRMHESEFGSNAVTLSTCHKPCNEYGTGFSCQGPDEYLSLEDLTLSKAVEAFSVIPEAFGPADWRKIRRWGEFKDWKKHSPTAGQYDIND